MPNSGPCLLALALLTVTAAPTAAAKPTGNVEACKLPALTGWHDEGHETDFDVFLRPQGTLRALMLFVDFPNAPSIDAPEGWQATEPYFALLEPAADWLLTASYGNVRLDITPVDTWYRMSQPDSAYGMDRTITFEQHVAYIAEAVALADDDVDFATFDIVYVVTPKNALAISNSPGFIDASDSRIFADGVPITHGATFGQNIWQWGDFGYRVLAHETGHVFSLPDLYAFDPAQAVHGFVGGWDLMGTLDGHAPDFFAWEKWKLGWLADSQVVCVNQPGSLSVRLTAAERRSGTKMVVVPTGPSTAYVIESRRAIGIDEKACSTGVLVYHVDSSVPTGSGPVRVVDATPGDAASFACTDLDVATFGLGERPMTFTDADIGLSVRVDRQNKLHDSITVTLTR